jgi:hypothetical protein
VTYVRYSPSSKTPDEGAPNGRLRGNQSVRSQAQPSAAGRPSPSFSYGSDYHFDHNLSLATERRLTAESLFLKENRTSGTFLDTLPMTGGQRAMSSKPRQSGQAAAGHSGPEVARVARRARRHDRTHRCNLLNFMRRIRNSAISVRSAHGPCLWRAIPQGFPGQPAEGSVAASARCVRRGLRHNATPHQLLVLSIRSSWCGDRVSEAE